VHYKIAPDRWLPPPLEDDRRIYLLQLTGDDDPPNAKSWTVPRKLRTALCSRLQYPRCIIGMLCLCGCYGSFLVGAGADIVSATLQALFYNL
jgi:hypothetical protein